MHLLKFLGQVELGVNIRFCLGVAWDARWSQSEHSDSAITLAACAPKEWSQRRNVVGVAVPALVRSRFSGVSLHIS